IPQLSGCVSGERSATPVQTANSDIAYVLTQYRTTDLRTLFRSEADIKKLEKQNLCSLEPSGAITKRKEIFVGNGSTLRNVIWLFYGHDYDGQVKVASQDSIVQTTIVGYNPPEQTNIMVHPGDLLFIQGRE